MIKEVELRKCEIAQYRNLTESTHYDEIYEYAAKLKGKKIIHLNATSSGGGVAEILNTLVPLMDCVKVNARWFYIEKNSKFFHLTKEIHNFLQGKKGDLTKEEKNFFLETNKEMAKEMQSLKPDLWILHDPQPVATQGFLSGPHKAIWRSHIDTSKTNRKVWNFLLPYLKKYDLYIFSMRRYIGEGLEYKKTRIFPPAIDPLNQKNVEMDRSSAKKIVGKFGIDTERPLISQISRFDPWKDPWGVIDAYRVAKNKFPNLQLALIGVFSLDDPQAQKIASELIKYSNKDKNIHILSNKDGVHALEVNAFQRVSDIVIQKSIKEGFGMTVTEAMWKEKPVIGGRAGGILEQIEDGVNGFLVTTVQETADRIVQLLEDENLAKRMGQKGKETVRKKYLIPRLLRDHLKLYDEILNGRS